MNDLTWKCHACGEKRPDDKISVYSFPLKVDGKIMKGATVNFRYCNDKPECFEIAKKAEKKGDLRP